MCLRLPKDILENLPTLNMQTCARSGADWSPVFRVVARLASAPQDESVTCRQGWICRLPAARENITVCGVAPSRLQPIGSRKQLEPRSRSTVHRGENFVS